MLIFLYMAWGWEKTLLETSCLSMGLPGLVPAVLLAQDEGIKGNMSAATRRDNIWWGHLQFVPPFSATITSQPTPDMPCYVLLHLIMPPCWHMDLLHLPVCTWPLWTAVYNGWKYLLLVPVMAEPSKVELSVSFSIYVLKCLINTINK